MQPLDPFLLECGGHWLNGLEEVFKLLDQPAVHHAGLEGRLVGVVGEEVPTGEDQIFEIRQGHEVSFLINYMTSEVPPLPSAWTTGWFGSWFGFEIRNGVTHFRDAGASHLASLGF